jgi:hypothetical protein
MTDVRGVVEENILAQSLASGAAAWHTVLADLLKDSGTIIFCLGFFITLFL